MKTFNNYLLMPVPKSAHNFDWDILSPDSDEIVLTYEFDGCKINCLETEFTTPNQFFIMDKFSNLKIDDLTIEDIQSCGLSIDDENDVLIIKKY